MGKFGNVLIYVLTLPQIGLSEKALEHRLLVPLLVALLLVLLLLLLLLILSLLALPLNSCHAAAVLAYCTFHLFTSEGVHEQTRTRLHVSGMVVGERITVVERAVSENEIKILSIRTVKLAALELPELVIHYALFEEIKIDLTHILYRVIGRPRRGRTGLSRGGRPRCGRTASLSSLPLSASLPR